ncbi:LysE family translocator [Candidatus Gracilibacteria bacterium]|nr:LysE family translocator [Candidatus Gracilibacteria bacterium]NJM88879.1 LysE family translocator [Hydrococcus sp. RU_2_2]NJP17835.1 LysE family translocator [Hydrococcus sp. CRU_1_1]NJQ98225.1 LysE family translocator [Hydrococcus sp. CSU_1_8]
MFDLSNLTLFLVAAIVLVVTPGPDTLYVIARSIGQGRKAGIISALGISVGLVAHISAAAIGLSALLMTSALAYSIVKYVGAAYLVYLGLRTILSRNAHNLVNALRKTNLKTVFWQGILSSTLNPKLALFFLAFLPQFVNPDRGAIALQIIALGIMFIIMAILWLLFVALLTSSAGEWLRKNASFAKFQRWFTGTIFIGLGVRLALSDQK